MLVALFAMLFWPNLRRLWDKTNPFDGDDNWKHAPFVPLIGLYYLYLNRGKLLATDRNTGWTWRHVALPAIAIPVVLCVTGLCYFLIAGMRTNIVINAVDAPLWALAVLWWLPTATVAIVIDALAALSPRSALEIFRRLTRGQP